MNEPRRFGRYEVEAEIGDGAMGRVFRAFDPLVRRTVAIKTIKSEYLTRDGREEYLRRFRREAQAAGALSHPGIVRIYDVGEDYIVMELLEGTPLSVLLEAQGALGIDETLRVLGPVAEALDHAHAAGVVHRDIKPANIMVLSDGRAKLMDFGVAHIESSVVTQKGEIFGSPSYMAPEQIAGDEVGPAADRFALGVVAYECLTGSKPFEGSSISAIVYRIVHAELRPPRELNVELPARYDAILARALAKLPAQRFPSAHSFVRALELREMEDLLDDLPAPQAAPRGDVPPLPSAEPACEVEPFAAAPHADATQALPPAAPRQPVVRRVWALAAVLLATLGVAAYLGLRRPEPVLELLVISEPPQAAVSLDGSEVGRTPLAIARLTPGAHTLRLTLPGYAPAELSLDVVLDVPLAPLRFVLQQLQAQLSVSSDPSGASVLLGGASVGRTPLLGYQLDAGAHELQLALAGHETWRKSLSVGSGESLHVDAQLAARPERVALAAEAGPAPVRAGDLVVPGPDVTEPRRLAGHSSAEYPEAARRLRLQGSVGVEFIVDEQGQATDLRVVESAGELLDQATLAAVSRWRYEPATYKGLEVKFRLRIKQTFKLER